MEILEKLKAAMEEFDCQTATLHRAEGEMLHLVKSIGVPEFLMDKISVIPFGKGIAGVAASEQRPVELCNLQEDLGGVAKPDAKKTGVAGSLAVPILGENEKVVGTIGIGKVTPHDFTEVEQKRLSDLGQEFISVLQ